MSIRSLLRTGAATVTVFAAISFVKWWLFEEQVRPKPTVNDFDSCVEAGHVVFDSTPRTCHADNGEVYIEEKTYSSDQPGPADIEFE